jgi:hypothetical protein
MAAWCLFKASSDWVYALSQKSVVMAGLSVAKIPAIHYHRVAQQASPPASRQWMAGTAFAALRLERP